MDKTLIDNIYAKVVNLEGLLLVAKHRENPPEGIWERIATESGETARLCAELYAAIEEQNPAPTPTATGEEHDADDNDDFVDDPADAPIQDEPEKPQPLSATETAIDSPDVTDDNDDDDDDATADIDEPQDTAAQQPERVDEMLSRQSSRDLRRAFTLNDHFRFRRELFGNSDTDFADTINTIGAMTSYGEAEEYFYDDLGWDPENEEVADFMGIIKRHFDSK